MLGLRLIKIVTSVDTALEFDDFAIGFISLIAAVVGILVGVRIHKSKKELEKYETKIDKEFKEKSQKIDEKLLRLSELQTSLSKDLDEVKDNVFNSKVLTVINLLEMTSEKAENSEDIYTSLVGLSVLVPFSFNNLLIFLDYLSSFNLLLSVLIMNLKKINPKHYEELFANMVRTRECLKLSKLKASMDEKYSKKIVNEENDMDEYIENLEVEIKLLQEELR